MHPNLAAALAYWESKRAGRRMPSRRDLDPPLEIPQLLPWVILTDVFHDPLDFRYRLIGSGAAGRSRRDYTGKRFSELPHTGPESQVWRDRAAVVETRAPILAAPPYTGQHPGVAQVRDIHLPLSEDGEKVTMILTVVAFLAS